MDGYFDDSSRWFDNLGVLTEPPFQVEDRVPFRTRVGTVVAYAPGRFGFRVQFDDASWGRFSADELAPLISE
jgi:hypothetical protein